MQFSLRARFLLAFVLALLPALWLVVRTLDTPPAERHSPSNPWPVALQQGEKAQQLLHQQVFAWHNLLIQGVQSDRFEQFLTHFHQKRDLARRALELVVEQLALHDPKEALLWKKLLTQHKALDSSFRMALEQYQVADSQPARAAARMMPPLESVFIHKLDAAMDQLRGQVRNPALSKQLLQHSQGEGKLVLAATLFALLFTLLTSWLTRQRLLHFRRVCHQAWNQVKPDEPVPLPKPGEETIAWAEHMLAQWAAEAQATQAAPIASPAAVVESEGVKPESEESKGEEPEGEEPAADQSMEPAPEEEEGTAAAELVFEPPQDTPAEPEPLTLPPPDEAPYTLPLASLEQQFRAFIRHSEGEESALLLVTLPELVALGDQLGEESAIHAMGQAQDRLLDALGEAVAIAPWGHHGLLLLLPPMAELLALADWSARVRDALQRPFSMGRAKLKLAPAISAVRLPEQAATLQTALAKARAALQMPAMEGVGYSLYDESWEARWQSHQTKLGALTEALQHRSGTLHFQPMVERRAAGVGAVVMQVSWLHQEEGTLTPDETLHWLASSGLVDSLALWLLMQGMALLARHRQELGELTLMVDLGEWALPDGQQCAQLEMEALRLGINRRKIAIVAPAERWMGSRLGDQQGLERMEKLGFGLVMRDLGRGGVLQRPPAAANLAMLMTTPELFNTPADESDPEAMVEAVVAMAHALELPLVATGLSQRTPLELAGHHGCEGFMGSFIAPMLTEEALLRWLQSSPWAANPDIS
uniref:EAL domain-containing protein n=1 Tax=Magnetococcus massalia (strain MO-1) TaxID=451514 RepID=A0A1S7LQY7_MAGMO|nr:Exported protein of unknown function. putative diguanylate phosphodiesterase [Candidatus Magnetococcus massalia]